MQRKKLLIGIVVLILLVIAGALFFSSLNRHEPGWSNEEGSVFCYNEKGKTYKGMHTIEGADYYFYEKKDDTHKKGELATGWLELNGQKCYFYEQKTKEHNMGQMAKGWSEIKGKTYYFYEEDTDDHKKGDLAKGWTVLKGQKYYFDKKTGESYRGVFRKGKWLYNFTGTGVFVRKIDATKKMAAFTFDDGPSDNTPRILKALTKNNSLATFFMVGSRISMYESDVKALQKAGCELANHSYNHYMLSGLSSGEIASEMKKCNSEIKRVTGATPKLCRTPGGETGDKISGNVGMPIILWSVDTLDWSSRNADSVYSQLVKNVGDGDIVLMHDLYSSTADAVIRAIPVLKNKGIEIVTVEELAAAKGVKLQKGQSYTDFNN